MRGQIIVGKGDGRRWLYVAEAHIQFAGMKGGSDRWVIAAFRTDGYYAGYGEPVPTLTHLEREYQFTSFVDVPEHIVAFAVESERERKESMESIENILVKAVREKNGRLGWEEMRALLESQKNDREKKERCEQEIGDELFVLMANTGGQQ